MARPRLFDLPLSPAERKRRQRKQHQQLIGCHETQAGGCHETQAGGCHETQVGDVLHFDKAFDYTRIIRSEKRQFDACAFLDAIGESSWSDDMCRYVASFLLADIAVKSRIDPMLAVMLIRYRNAFA